MNGPEREPIPALAIYNPALLKKDELIGQFTARKPLLDRLLRDLKSADDGALQHQLIVGPRGSGKTTLLRRLRFAIEDDPELRRRWIPLVFPEEQNNVARLSDLWLNCLDALGDMLEREGREEEADKLDELIESLPTDDEKARARAALDLLTGLAKKEERGLVLLFDNSDLIFDRLKEDQWAIREVLSADNHLLFIGATSAPIEATYNHEGAFYDFFKNIELRPLTEEEAREVIINLATIRQTPHVIDLVNKERGRLRSMHILTGGNLRTIVVLYQVLARSSDDNIQTDLEQLLDQYTPFYKHRFDSLSPQQQQIVDALALNWDPISAADLAEKLRMETNAVSAQLNRLVGDGVVDKVASPPGERTFFQVTERFFNIWYLMRASRRVRRRLLWLVEFLKLFYGQDTMGERARSMIERRAKSSGDHRTDRSYSPELYFAYARATDDRHLRRALEAEGVATLLRSRSTDRKGLRSMLDLEGEDAPLKDLVERMQTLTEIREKIAGVRTESPDWNPDDFCDRLLAAPDMSAEEKRSMAEQIAGKDSNELLLLIEKFTGQSEALARRFGPEPCRKLLEAIRNGYMAGITDVEGADSEAVKLDAPSLRVISRLAGYEETKDRRLLDEIDEIIGQVRTPHVWLSWIETIIPGEGGKEKFESVYPEIERLAGHDARTWNRLGILLAEHLKRFDEAEAAFRKAIQIDPNNAFAWNNLGNLLSDLKRFDEAEAAYRKAIEINPNYTSAWHNLGNLLSDLKRFDEAEVAYRKALEINPNYAYAWNWLGNLLSDLKRFDEAEAAYRKAIEIDPDNSEFLNSLAWMFYLIDKNPKEAEELSRKAVEKEPASPHCAHTLACILVRNGKWEDAVAAISSYFSIGDEDFHERTWQDTMILFKDIVGIDRAGDAVNILDETGMGERSRPLREALKAIADDDPDYLLRVAPEVRQPAKEIIDILLPEGRKLGEGMNGKVVSGSRRRRAR
ncbi:MAG: tetratricopeptide repeat protein [Acidobacteriota bacterium]|nr:MAG: tetratricopeptide repeat protein [Acidobacteriota bacterium]